MNNYIIAIDQSTSATKAMLFNEQCEMLQRVNVEHRQYYPKAGWVEHDAEEIYRNVLMAVEELMRDADPTAAYSMAITNQRETVVVWDKTTGKPVYHAVVWQCMRGADICNELKAQGYGPMVMEKSGLLIDPYFAASGAKWILDNVEGAREKADRGDLVMGTMESWLIWKLTGGKRHVSDYTNASRTMLMNIHTLDWDDDLLGYLDIPRSMMPEVRWSSGDFGRVSSEIMTHMPPIMGVAGDQQASLFGHCCFEPGDTKNTYGTGCFMLMNTGERVVESQHGLVSTIGIAEPGKISYALEGSIFHAGSIMQWLRDKLGIIASAGETAAICRSVDGNEGCYLVPAFSGLGAPWWDPNARGMICGLTTGSDRSTIVRAACESMAYQSYDVLRAMEADSGIKLASLSVDGGASRNEFIMQFQADLLGISIVQTEAVETTALGAAYLAGLAVGYWEDHEDLMQNLSEAKTFDPTGDPQTVAANLMGWHDAVARTRTTQ